MVAFPLLVPMDSIYDSCTLSWQGTTVSGSTLWLLINTTVTSPLFIRHLLENGHELAFVCAGPKVKTCFQWADHFIAILDRKTKEHSEIHVLFDHYDITSSLKEATHK